MNKRILSLAIALVLVLTACTALANDTANVMYLYAPTGSTVNVRSEPSTAGGSATVLMMAPIGTMVEVVEYLSNGWTMISWNGGVAYVMTQFLSSVQRAPSGGSVVPVTADTEKEKAMDSLYTEIRNFTQVTNSYTIYPQPRRASGFVNFRLAPVQYGKEYYRVYAGNAMTVLGETRNWYQVRDENTGVVGYIMKSLTTVAR